MPTGFPKQRFYNIYLFLGDVWPTLHLWIRSLHFIWRLAYHLNSRWAFQEYKNSEITMRGQSKGDMINDAIECERIQLRWAAEQVLKLRIDQPDPHGTGIF